MENCLDDKPLSLKLDNAAVVVEVANALQEALMSGKQVRFDEVGQRMK